MMRFLALVFEIFMCSLALVFENFMRKLERVMIHRLLRQRNEAWTEIDRYLREHKLSLGDFPLSEGKEADE